MKVFIGQIAGLLSAFSGIELGRHNYVSGAFFLLCSILIATIGVLIDD